MQTNREKWIVIGTHVCGWILFLLFPFINEPESLGHLFRPPFFMLLLSLLLIGYFYLNANVIVPRFLYEKKVVEFIGITLLLLFLICFVIPYLMRVFFMPFPPPHSVKSPPPDWMPDFSHKSFFLKNKMMQLGFFRQLTLFLIVFIVSTGIQVITEWYNEKKRLQEMEHSKVSAELSSLKAQIHPHFLFNSLNSIYYLTLSRDDKAAESIMRLSNFLRFVTTESSKEFILLENEIHTLGEYIELQKLRVSEKLQLSFEVEGNPQYRKIIPLLFLPFVENAFKYGVSAHVESKIDICIKIDKGTLEFSVSNTIIPMQKGLSQSGVGLENIRKRLELIYSGRYILNIKEEDGMFYVYLKIKL